MSRCGGGAGVACVPHVLLGAIHWSALIPRDEWTRVRASRCSWGWDAGTMKYCDLLEAGVIDPAKVTINALENSASIAGLVLTTECLVTEIPVEKTEADQQAEFDAQGMNAGMAGGMPGGM